VRYTQVQVQFEKEADGAKYTSK